MVICWKSFTFTWPKEGSTHSFFLLPLLAGWRQLFQPNPSQSSHWGSQYPRPVQLQINVTNHRHNPHSNCHDNCHIQHNNRQELCGFYGGAGYNCEHWDQAFHHHVPSLSSSSPPPSSGSPSLLVLWQEFWRLLLRGDDTPLILKLRWPPQFWSLFLTHENKCLEINHISNLNIWRSVQNSMCPSVHASVSGGFGGFVYTGLNALHAQFCYAHRVFKLEI